MAEVPPDYGFTVAPRFYELEVPAGVEARRSAAVKGVLLSHDMPHLPSQHPDRPLEIGLDFLTTDLAMHHGELLRQSPYPYDELNQPVRAVRPGRLFTYYFAVRYTQWKDRMQPLELGVMLDRDRLNVTDGTHYLELRRTIAVASARAILDPEGQGASGSIMLKVANNFRRPKWFASTPPFFAANIRNLYDLLSRP